MYRPDLNFGTTNVRTGCINETVEIVLLDFVEVDHHHVLKADPRECLAHHAPDAACADDSNSQTSEIVLGLFAPRRYRPNLPGI
jgi:hypothetical protein